MKKISAGSWVLIGLLVVLAGVAVYILRSVLSDDSPRKKNNVTTVTLLKPPPPPQIKEKPPEPEQVKQVQKQEVVTEVPQNIAQQDSKPGDPDNAPAGSELGVDAEGGAGGDAFGLVGKKGGRSLLAGGGGGGLGSLSLLTKFAGYVQNAQTEVQKRVMKRLDEEGWFPKGKLQTIVRISIDAQGAIIKFLIIGSSGNHKMDEAVKQSLKGIRVSQPPPDGMPRTMDIKIASQG